jgi:hypothetical protein
MCASCAFKNQMQKSKKAPQLRGLSHFPIPLLVFALTDQREEQLEHVDEVQVQRQRTHD